MRRAVFTHAELAYLHSRPGLARLATVGPDGTPHVVPTGWVHNPQTNTIDISGHDLSRTRKFRDVAATGRAAVVIDDVETVQPWRPRAIEVRGPAQALHNPKPLIRIHPEQISSWGLPGPGPTP